MTRIAPAFLASALLAFAPTARAGDDAPATGAVTEKTPLEAAIAAFEAGHFVAAVEKAESVGAEDATWPKARYLVGEIELVLGDPAAAEAAFHDVLTKRPTSAPALTGLGRARIALGREAEAVDPLEKAVLADAKSARARAYLGVARIKTGKAKQGLDDIAAAAKLDPLDAEVARTGVEERIAANDLAGAGKVAAAYAKARKGHPTGYFLQALVEDRSKKADEAIALYEKAIAADPSYLDAHKDLAILCVTQNPLYQDAVRTKKAMEHFQAYVDLGGKDEKLKELYGTMKSFLDGQLRK